MLKDPNENEARLREGEDCTGCCVHSINKRRVGSIEHISSSILNNNNSNNNNSQIPLQSSKSLAIVEKSPMENDVVRIFPSFLSLE